MNKRQRKKIDKKLIWKLVNTMFEHSDYLIRKSGNSIYLYDVRGYIIDNTHVETHEYIVNDKKRVVDADICVNLNAHCNHITKKCLKGE